jgi:hypothetical protein
VSHVLGVKAVIVLGSMCKVGTRVLLIWGHSLRTMQVMQVHRATITQSLQ